MQAVIAKYLEEMELGKPQQHENMAVFLLFNPLNDSPKYLTLKEALEKGLLTVKEVNRGGSVPELKVLNKGSMPVLLLDGEEVAGAKQNRILNTTILLKEDSTTIIPVSCTEQGRWDYISEKFVDSDVVVSPKLRRAKAASVSSSLERAGQFASDQGEVWDEIHEMAALANVKTPTGAMKDVFEQRMEDLDKYLKAFENVNHQKGLLVLINGEPVGFDFVSLESAYKVLHPKLVKSYCLDALFQKKKKGGKLNMDNARAFLEEAKKCNEKIYESVGYGWDYRYQGKSIVGSALAYEDKAIHLAFFRIPEIDKSGRMSGFRKRRDFRIY